MTKGLFVQLWDPFDQRLPKDVLREPPTPGFCESMLEDQINPITLGYNDKEGYFILAGRKRLLAQRINASEHKGVKIKVIVLEGKTKKDIPLYSYTENHQRSDNELTDYEAISNLLGTRGTTYENVAEYLGTTVASVKAIEKKWASVPKWAIKAVVKGEMSKTAARKIGAKGTDTQKILQKQFKETGSLTVDQVDSTEKVFLADLMPQLIAEPPKVIAVTLLDELENLVRSGSNKAALDYIKSLRGGYVK